MQDRVTTPQGITLSCQGLGSGSRSHWLLDAYQEFHNTCTYPFPGMLFEHPKIPFEEAIVVQELLEFD